MPLKKLRAKLGKERGGDNPQVIIETFEREYNNWKKNVDELADNDPDRQQIMDDFAEACGDDWDGNLPQNESEFNTMRGDWDGNGMSKFVDVLCPKWFEIEENEEKE